MASDGDAEAPVEGAPSGDGRAPAIDSRKIHSNSDAASDLVFLNKVLEKSVDTGAIVDEIQHCFRAANRLLGSGIEALHCPINMGSGETVKVSKEGIALIAGVSSMFALPFSLNGEPLGEERLKEYYDDKLFLESTDLEKVVTETREGLDKLSQKPAKKEEIGIFGCHGIQTFTRKFEKVTAPEHCVFNDRVHDKFIPHGNQGMSIELSDVSPNILSLTCQMEFGYLKKSCAHGPDIGPRMCCQPDWNMREMNAGRSLFKTVKDKTHTGDMDSGMLYTALGLNHHRLDSCQYAIYPYKATRVSTSSMSETSFKAGILDIPSDARYVDLVPIESGSIIEGLQSDSLLSTSYAAPIHEDDVDNLHQALFGHPFSDAFSWIDYGDTPQQYQKAVVMFCAVLKKLDKMYQGLHTVEHWMTLYARLFCICGSKGIWVPQKHPMDRCDLIFRCMSMFNRISVPKNAILDGNGRAQGTVFANLLKWPGVTADSLYNFRRKSLDLSHLGVKPTFQATGKSSARVSALCLHRKRSGTESHYVKVDNKHFINKTITSCLHLISNTFQEASKKGEQTALGQSIKLFYDLVAGSEDYEKLLTLRELRPKNDRDKYEIPSKTINNKALSSGIKVHDNRNGIIQLMMHCIFMYGGPHFREHKTVSQIVQKDLEDFYAGAIATGKTFLVEQTEVSVADALKNGPTARLHAGFINEFFKSGRLLRTWQKKGRNLATLLVLSCFPVYCPEIYRSEAIARAKDMVRKIDSPSAPIVPAPGVCYVDKLDPSTTLKYESPKQLRMLSIKQASLIGGSEDLDRICILIRMLILAPFKILDDGFVKFFEERFNPTKEQSETSKQKRLQEVKLRWTWYWFYQTNSVIKKYGFLIPISTYIANERPALCKFWTENIFRRQFMNDIGLKPAPSAAKHGNELAFCDELSPDDVVWSNIVPIFHLLVELALSGKKSLSYTKVESKDDDAAWEDDSFGDTNLTFNDPRYARPSDAQIKKFTSHCCRFIMDGESFELDEVVSELVSPSPSRGAQKVLDDLERIVKEKTGKQAQKGTDLLRYEMYQRFKWNDKGCTLVEYTGETETPTPRSRKKKNSEEDEKTETPEQPHPSGSSSQTAGAAAPEQQAAGTASLVQSAAASAAPGQQSQGATTVPKEQLDSGRAVNPAKMSQLTLEEKQRAASKCSRDHAEKLVRERFLRKLCQTQPDGSAFQQSESDKVNEVIQKMADRNKRFMSNFSTTVIIPLVDQAIDLALFENIDEKETPLSEMDQYKAMDEGKPWHNADDWGSLTAALKDTSVDFFQNDPAENKTSGPHSKSNVQEDHQDENKSDTETEAQEEPKKMDIESQKLWDAIPEGDPLYFARTESGGLIGPYPDRESCPQFGSLKKGVLEFSSAEAALKYQKELSYPGKDQVCSIIDCPGGERALECSNCGKLAHDVCTQVFVHRQGLKRDIGDFQLHTEEAFCSSFCMFQVHLELFGGEKKSADENPPGKSDTVEAVNQEASGSQKKQVEMEIDDSAVSEEVNPEVLESQKEVPDSSPEKESDDLESQFLEQKGDEPEKVTEKPAAASKLTFSSDSSESNDFPAAPEQDEVATQKSDSEPAEDEDQREEKSSKKKGKKRDRSLVAERRSPRKKKDVTGLDKQNPANTFQKRKKRRGGK